MAVNVLITDRKVWNKYGNGDSFNVNLADSASYLRGGVMNVQKAVYTVEVEWAALASTSTGVEFFISGNKLNRNTGSWIGEGFSIGDEISLVGLSPLGTLAARNIVNITDSIIIFDGAAEPSVTYTSAILYGGATDLFALEYSFGIIENQSPANYQSLLDGADQTYYAADIGLDLGAGRVTTWTIMTPKSPVRSWMTSRTGATRCRFVSRNGNVQTFEIEHEYLIMPYNNSGLFTGNLSLKYVSKFDFRRLLPNLNTSKIAEDDLQLGSVGYFDENYDGYENDFSITNLVYTDVATGSAASQLNIKSKTNVTMLVNSVTGHFSTLDPFVVFHSYLPPADVYSNKIENYYDIWLFDSNRNQIDNVASTASILTAISSTLVNANQIVVQFDVEFTASQQLQISEGDDYVLAVEVGDGDTANQTYNVTLEVDRDKYSSDSNIQDLFISRNFGFKQYNNFLTPLIDLNTDLKGWIGDDNLFYSEFGLNRTAAKNSKFKGLRFLVVAFNDISNDWFELQREEIDLSGLIDLPINTYNANPFSIEYLDVQDTRGYTLAAGDEFNLMLLETDDNDGTYQYYKATIGFKMNWQDWISLPNADAVFFDNTKTFNGLNNNASNYSLLNDYSIRVILQADLSGLDDLGIAGETTYNNVSQPFDILDFGEQDNSPTIWSCEIFTFDEFGVSLNADNLGTSEITEVHAVFTDLIRADVGDINDYWGYIGLQEENQPAFDVDVIASNKTPNSNIKLQPLNGELYAKMVKTSNTVITVKALTNPDNLKDGFNYLFSYELKSFIEPPIPITWTFKTAINVPSDGAFDPSMSQVAGGETVTWLLIAAYTQTTNLLNIATRTGLDASELAGVCQNVVVSFSTNDPTNIERMAFESDFICEVLDLSLFTSLETARFDNNEITSVIFPAITVLNTSLIFNNNSIVGVVDLSPLGVNMSGDIQFQFNSALTNFAFPLSVTNNIAKFYAFSCGLVDTLDMSFSANQFPILFRVYSNPLLTAITVPISTSLVNEFTAYSCGLTGTLDISGLSNLGGSFQVQSNNLGVGLNEIINPPMSNELINLYRCNNCKINVPLDLSGLKGLQITLFIYSNPSMVQFTLPTTPSIGLTKFWFSNCGIVGTADLSPSARLGGEIRGHDNPLMTAITLPPLQAPANTFDYVALFDCDLSSLDLGNYDWVAVGESLLDCHNNPSLSSLTFPISITGSIYYLDLSDCAFTSLDFSTLGVDKYGYQLLVATPTKFDVSRNSALSTLILPTTNNELNIFSAANCLLSGSVSLASFTNFGGNVVSTGTIDLSGNIGIAEVILPTTTNKVTSINLEGCNLTLLSLTPITGTNANIIDIDVNNNGMSTANMNQLVIDILAKVTGAGNVWGDGGSLSILVGNNAPLTGTGLTARNTLVTTHSWNVT